MLCRNCQCENNYNANYCKKCGHPFTEEQRKQAFDGTWAGQIEKFFEIVSWAKLEKITGNKLFRIASVVILLIMGISNVMTHGSKFAIEDGLDYELISTKDSDSFVLLCEESSISLQMYVPSCVEGITVKKIDDDGLVQSEASYDVSDEIVLSAFNDHLYLIEADYPSHQEVILVRLLYEGN